MVDASAGTFSSTGAGTCRVEASGAATANFVAASAQQDVTIAKAAATVTLSNLTQTYTGSPLIADGHHRPAGAGDRSGPTHRRPTRAATP